MTENRARRHLPFVILIVVALMLTMMPLPESIRSFRPDWVALALVFFAMRSPRSYSVGIAWLIGIVLDVTTGTLLGQHALALCVITFVTIKFHLLMRMFPLGQLALTVFALLALYQFLLYWINGVAGIDVPAVTYWGPVVVGALIWPFLYMFLQGLQFRARPGG